ncbi:tyrosine-type recombinase/integrase [Streptosporangium sp. NPDC003464]
MRERLLRRLLYETAARAEEILTLNVEDLGTEFRRARVVSKGGALEYVHRQTGTARLLPRLPQGRTSGPVFLAGRRAPVPGPRAPAAADIDPVTKRGRLSYPRAEYLFKTASAKLDPHGAGWPLHQLRHPALQHLAQAGERTRAAGQEPSPAPGQPRPLHTARRTNLRPYHRRSRSRPASPDPLTFTPPR